MELYGILGPDWQTVKKAGNSCENAAETEELEDFRRLLMLEGTYIDMK